MSAGLLLQPIAASERGIGFPRDVSSEGWRVDRIIEVASYPIAALALVGIAWLLYSVLAHRRGPVWFTRGTSRRAIAVPVAFATFVFVVVDGYLFARSTIDLDEVYLRTADVEADGALRVQINARQWAWDVRYAGADGRFATADDVVLVDELRLQVGQPVVVQLAASDVVHAFYLPNFRVKRDAIPGQVTSLWFQGDEAGTFEIACAQHCGVGHYRMRGLVTVMPEQEFSAWQRAAESDARRTAEEDRRAATEEATEQPTPSRAWGWPWSEGAR